MKHCKRLVSLALAFVLVLGLVPPGLSDLLPVSEVNAASVYSIQSAEDWKEFAQSTNDYHGERVTLEADITLEGEIPAKNYFRGTFDGQGHTITIKAGSNYVTADGVDNTTVDSMGLFGTLSDATVQNLAISVDGVFFASSLRAPKLSEGDNRYLNAIHFGILAGTASASTIQRVAVLNTQGAVFASVVNHFQTADANTGAVVGRALEGSVIQECYNGCDVFTYRYTPARKAAVLRAGGIAGFVGESTVVTNCINYGGTVSTYHSNPEQASNTASLAGGIAAGVSSGSTVSNCIVEVGIIRTEDIVDSRLVADQSVEEACPLNNYYSGTAGYIYALKDSNCTITQCYTYNGAQFGRTGIQVTDSVTTGTDAESKAKQALIGDGSVWVEKTNGKLGLAWMVQTPKITLEKTDNDEDVTIAVEQAAPVAPRSVASTTWEYEIQGALMGREAAPDQPEVVTAASSSVTGVEIRESRTDTGDAAYYSGGTYQFYAEVTGSNVSAASAPVTWSLVDAPAGGTAIKISSDGLLTVPETYFGELKIKAEAGGKSAEKTITVLPAALEITTKPTQAEQGGKVDFAATVKGYFSAASMGDATFPYKVEWSVAGGTAGTSIDASGTLTVGLDEAAGTKLTVTAALTPKNSGDLTGMTEDEKKLLPSATAEVTVTAARTVTQTVKPAESGQTQTAELTVGQKLRMQLDPTAVDNRPAMEGYTYASSTIGYETNSPTVLEQASDSTEIFAAKAAGGATVTATLTLIYNKNEETGGEGEGENPPAQTGGETETIQWTSTVTVTVSEAAAAQTADTLTKMSAVNGTQSGAKYNSTPVNSYSIRFKTTGENDKLWYKLTTQGTPGSADANWNAVSNASPTAALTDAQLQALRGNGLYLWMFRETSDSDTTQSSGVVGWLIKEETSGAELKATVTVVEGYEAKGALAYQASVSASGTWTVTNGVVAGSPFSALELLRGGSDYESLAECELRVTVRQQSGSGTYSPREGEFLTETTASVAVGDAALMPTIQPRTGKLPNNKFSITVPAQENVEVYYQIYPNRSAEEISPAEYPTRETGILYDVAAQKEIPYPTGNYEEVTVIAVTYPKGGGKASDADIVTYTAENLTAPNAPELVIGDSAADFVGTDLYLEGEIFKFRYASNTSGGEAYQVYYTVNGKTPDPNSVGTGTMLYDASNPPTMVFGLAEKIDIMAIVYDPNYGVSSSVATYTVQKLSAAAKPSASIPSGSTVRPSGTLTLELNEDFVATLPDISNFESAEYAEYSADSEFFAQYKDYELASNSDEPIEGMRYLVIDTGTSLSSLDLPILRYSTNDTDVLEDVGAEYQYAVCQVWYEVTQEEGEDGEPVQVTKYYIRYTNPDEIVFEGVAGDKILVRAAMYPPSGVTSYLASGEITFHYTIRGSVSKPTAIPAGDTAVNIGAAIALSGDAGTEIYYTTDGSTRPEVVWVDEEKDEDGTVIPAHWEPANDKTFKYEGDIRVPYTQQTLFILHTIAVSADDSLEPSEMTSFIYTVNPLEKAASPTASPVTDASEPTRLANGERISLTTTTLNTDIYYTTDGSVPSYEARDAWDAAYAAAADDKKGENEDGTRWYEDASGARQTEPATRVYDPQRGIQMAASESSEFFFVTAVAVDKNRELPSHETSDPVSFVYRIAQVDAPSASPATSAESVAVIQPNTTISLTSGTAGAEIYYTKDTTMPDVSDTDAVKAAYAAWLEGWNAAGENNRGTDERGIRWYFGVGGVRCTEPSTIPYDAAQGITMPKTVTTFFTLRAVAVVSDGSRADSDAVTFSYQLPEPVQAVYASPVDGTAVEYGASVTLSCSTEDAQIFYRIYTQEPGEDDTPVVNQDLSYTEPITITKEVWIQAVATKAGMESAVATYHYTVAPTAEAPTISLPSGSVVPKGTRVVLAGTGTIVYTLDGSDPKAADSEKQYGTAVNLDGDYGATVTVRAYIQRDGYTPSDTVSYSYTLCKEEDYLNISVENGSVIGSGTSVTLSTAVTNGQIFYTLDGSTPQVTNVYSASASKDYTTYEWASGTSSTVAGSGFTLSGDPDSAVTVRAIVVVNGGDGGQVSTFTYRFQPQAASPTADIPTGAVVFDGAAVTLTAKEGTIYYTLDGKDPTTSSAIYSEPIDVSGSASTVLKAMAVVDGKAASAVVTYRYTRAGQAGTPVFSVTSGEIDTGTAVAITSGTPGAAIYYSTDGTTPTADNLQNLTLYVAPISVTRAVTIRAIAVSDTLDPSDVAEATYTVREPAPVPQETEDVPVVTETVTDRLASRRTYDSAGDGPKYSDIVLRENVTNTVLSAAAGALPDGAVLTVTQETPSRSDQASVSTSLGQTIARVYSASLTVNGDPVSPTGTVELGFAIPAEYQNGIVTVSRINDDGTLTQYTARRSGGMAYIETDGLGRFAVSVPAREQEAAFSLAWLIGGGILLAAAAGAIVVLIARRRRKEEEAEEPQPYADLTEFQDFDTQ